MANENIYENVTTIGASSGFRGVEKKFWVVCNDKNYMYKIDDDHNYGFGEMFASYLLPKLGVDCVNVLPAQDQENKTSGVIVESFIKPSVSLTLTMGEFVEIVKTKFYCYEHCNFSLEELLRLEPKLNEKNAYFMPDVMKKFKQMVVCDFFLGNRDRHINNVEFLVYQGQNGEKYLDLTPMFDNGRILGLGAGSGMMAGQELAYSDSPKMTLNRRQGKKRGTALTKSVGISILDEMEQDPEVKKLVEKFLSLDFDKIIDEFHKNSPYELNFFVIRTIKDYFNERVKLFKELMQIKQQKPRKLKEYFFDPVTFPLFRKPWGKLKEDFCKNNNQIVTEAMPGLFDKVIIQKQVAAQQEINVEIKENQQQAMQGSGKDEDCASEWL